MLAPYSFSFTTRRLHCMFTQVIGKYVDETKEYRRVTKACMLLSLIFLLPLGLEERRVGKEPVRELWI